MVITLTTDFGYADSFVGIMKGVIYGINPEATIVDLSHGVPAQDVLAGALILRHAVRYFSHDTIHVAVVDPGVGSARKPILAEADGGIFVGPDNGLWSLALAGRTVKKIVHLSNDAFHMKPTSGTFHGRDIFAPVAAHLSLGVLPEVFGDSLASLAHIDLPPLQKVGTELIGEIIYIDGFGNLFTNIEAADLADKPLIEARLRGLTVAGISPNYAAVATGACTALVNSWGLLEIAVNQGHAQRQIGAVVGDKVQVRFLG